MASAVTQNQNPTVQNPPTPNAQPLSAVKLIFATLEHVTVLGTIMMAETSESFADFREIKGMRLTLRGLTGLLEVLHLIAILYYVNRAKANSALMFTIFLAGNATAAVLMIITFEKKHTLAWVIMVMWICNFLLVVYLIRSELLSETRKILAIVRKEIIEVICGSLFSQPEVQINHPQTPPRDTDDPHGASSNAGTDYHDTLQNAANA